MKYKLTFYDLAKQEYLRDYDRDVEYQYPEDLEAWLFDYDAIIPDGYYVDWIAFEPLNNRFIYYMFESGGDPT